jgi:hypothetical protein
MCQRLLTTPKGGFKRYGPFLSKTVTRPDHLWAAGGAGNISQARQPAVSLPRKRLKTNDSDFPQAAQVRACTNRPQAITFHLTQGHPGQSPVYYRVSYQAWNISRLQTRFL